MKADKIKVDKFEFQNILECRGKKAFNEHGYLIIRGIIKAEHETEYLKLMQTQEKVHVTVTDMEGNETNLFYGILYEANIRHDNGVSVMQIHLKTGSYLADIKKHVRSFQNGNTDCQTIAETCLKGYPDGNFSLGERHNFAVNDFVMQYDETDWEFLIRVMSNCHTMLLPDDETGCVKLYLGIPDYGSIQQMTSDSFYIHKNIGNADRLKEEMQIQEEDLWVYEVETRDIYKVGERVNFLGRTQIIYAMETNWKGSQLVHTYYLKTKAGMAVSKQFNERLTGSSLTAYVLGVKQDQVLISIEKEENSNSGAKLFPYATIYSSPDGTGWYCMPEAGDEVRLCFPSNDENDAYVESSVHLSIDTDDRKNPQEKSVMNSQRKEILFTPDRLIIRNNAGLSIELLDGQGINIVSDKSIFINAGDTVSLNSNSGEIEMNALKNIEMTQGKAQLKIADQITMTGGKINLN